MLDEYIPGFSLPINTSFSVRGTLPPLDYLKFPPAALPPTLPPPPDHPTLAHPFTIRTDWYNALLSPTVPITVALVYASVVTYLNSVNQNRKYKPWAFSQTQFFKLLVIIHNTFLAVYSGWTFVGMVNDLAISLVPPTGPYGLAGTVDSLCKIQGPRGLGSAAIYNETTSTWGIANRTFHLGADGLAPETSDVGRIWNEGLAFYGWLFYISKYYEVIDTFIILAKGKKSSLLQTYHHAGAMLCMWAGIRYMSPPIWMFVFVNSFIHTIMYTFYLCTAVGTKVPVPLKKTLTTMQITQFVVGAAYAFGHLFIKYQSPYSVPYLYHLGDIASALPSDASSAASIAFTTASAGTGAWLKKAALRAAGREGLAENVFNEQGKPFGIDAVHAAQAFVKREELRYRDQLQWVHCLDTSGQTFAILLNCMYLAPLTWLFVQFFIKAYNNRIRPRRRSSASQTAYAVLRSGEDASKGVVRHLSEAFQDKQTGVTELGDDNVVIDGGELLEEVKSVVDSAKSGTAAALSAVKDKADQVKAKALTDSPADLDKAVDETKGVKETVKGNDPSTNTAIESESQNDTSVKDESESAVHDEHSSVQQNELTATMHDNGVETTDVASISQLDKRELHKLGPEPGKDSSPVDHDAIEETMPLTEDSKTTHGRETTGETTEPEPDHSTVAGNSVIANETKDNDSPPPDPALSREEAQLEKEKEVPKPAIVEDTHLESTDHEDSAAKVDSDGVDMDDVNADQDSSWVHVSAEDGNVDTEFAESQDSAIGDQPKDKVPEPVSVPGPVNGIEPANDVGVKNPEQSSSHSEPAIPEIKNQDVVEDTGHVDQEASDQLVEDSPSETVHPVETAKTSDNASSKAEASLLDNQTGEAIPPEVPNESQDDENSKNEPEAINEQFQPQQKIVTEPEPGPMARKDEISSEEESGQRTLSESLSTSQPTESTTTKDELSHPIDEADVRETSHLEPNELSETRDVISKDGSGSKEVELPTDKLHETQEMKPDPVPAITEQKPHEIMSDTEAAESNQHVKATPPLIDSFSDESAAAAAAAAATVEDANELSKTDKSASVISGVTTGEDTAAESANSKPGDSSELRSAASQDNAEDDRTYAEVVTDGLPTTDDEKLDVQHEQGDHGTMGKEAQNGASQTDHKFIDAEISTASEHDLQMEDSAELHGKADVVDKAQPAEEVSLPSPQPALSKIEEIPDEMATEKEPTSAETEDLQPSADEPVVAEALDESREPEASLKVNPKAEEQSEGLPTTSATTSAEEEASLTSETRPDGQETKPDNQETKLAEKEETGLEAKKTNSSKEAEAKPEVEEKPKPDVEEEANLDIKEESQPDVEEKPKLDVEEEAKPDMKEESQPDVKEETTATADEEEEAKPDVEEVKPHDEDETNAAVEEEMKPEVKETHSDGRDSEHDQPETEPSIRSDGKVTNGINENTEIETAHPGQIDDPKTKLAEHESTEVEKEDKTVESEQKAQVDDEV